MKTNTFTIQGAKYKVRLMKGLHYNNPSKACGKSNYGSEWSQLMLPIHEQAIGKSWAYGKNVENDIKPLKYTLGKGIPLKDVLM